MGCGPSKEAADTVLSSTSATTVVQNNDNKAVKCDDNQWFVARSCCAGEQAAVTGLPLHLEEVDSLSNDCSGDSSRNGCSSSHHSDVVEEVKKDLASSERDLTKLVVRIQSSTETPIEEVYDGVHDGEELGEGAGGIVRRAKHRATGIDFAVKCLDKSRINTEEDLKQLREEIIIMCSIDHPNIVRIEEVFESSEKIFIVQELCTGGDLFDRLEKMPDFHYTEAQCAKLVKQMLSAICYLHKNHIIHRDLKLENFLFLSSHSNSVLEMIDFGLSKHFETGQHHHERVGTPYTIAPEIFEGDYDEKVDIWALGVITYLILSGETPFGGLDGEALHLVKSNIMKAEVVLEPQDVWQDVSDEAKAFVKRMLDSDPKRRPTAKQLKQDPWIQKWADLDASEGKQQLSPTTVEALIAFKESSNMQKLLSRVLSFTLRPEQIVNLRTEFDKIDTECSGEISFLDLNSALEESVEERTLADISSCIKMRKAAETLRWHEFLAAEIGQTGIDERNMRLAFDRLDSQRKGFLTLDDLTSVFGSIIDDEELQQTWCESFTECKAEPDKITFADFRNLVQGKVEEALSPRSSKPVRELTEVASLAPLMF